MKLWQATILSLALCHAALAIPGPVISPDEEREDVVVNGPGSVEVRPSFSLPGSFPTPFGGAFNSQIPPAAGQPSSPSTDSAKSQPLSAGGQSFGSNNENPKSQPMSSRAAVPSPPFQLPEFDENDISASMEDRFIY